MEFSRKKKGRKGGREGGKRDEILLNNFFPTAKMAGLMNIQILTRQGLNSPDYYYPASTLDKILISHSISLAAYWR